MRILVNGVWHDIVATDVAAALKELGYQDAIVATALNGGFIAGSARSTAPVSEGDRLEIVAPMQGG